MTIDFLEPIHGVATGQVAAIWYQKWCVGSGVIEQAWTADEVPIQTFKQMKGRAGKKTVDEEQEVEEDSNPVEEKAVMAG